MGADSAMLGQTHHMHDLFRHDVRTPRHAPEDSFVQHRPDYGRRGTLQDLGPLQS